MLTFTKVSFPVIVAWCMVTFPQAALVEEKTVVSTKPVLVLSGADSRVDKPAYHRVTSQQAWDNLWLSHLGKTEADKFREHIPVVTIDFEKNIVIAIFQGTSTNSRGLQITSVDEAKDFITLCFDDISYQTAGGLGVGGGSVQVTPYAFVVVPRSSKVIVVKEDIQGLKDKPPEWKERARLRAEESRG